jgi:hypothetical protein
MKTLVAALALSTLSIAACAVPAEDTETASAPITTAPTACTHITLTTKPLGSLAQMKEEVDASCSAWTCSMDHVVAFASGCSNPSSINMVAEAVLAERGGRTLTREQLLATPYFQFHAPNAIAQIDGWAGTTDVVAQEISRSLSCPNCHKFSVRYVLFYPSTGAVVYIDGQYGYDG